MPNTQEAIKCLIDRAEECRALAGIVDDANAAKSYLQLASTYEALAKQERSLLAVRERGVPRHNPET